MFMKRNLACSFCGKKAAQVKKLVAGSRGYICDVCAAEAHRIMSAQTSGPSAATASGTYFSHVLTRIRLWGRGQRFEPSSSIA